MILLDQLLPFLGLEVFQAGATLACLTLEPLEFPVTMARFPRAVCLSELG
jgi:hypothetical protein